MAASYFQHCNKIKYHRPPDYIAENHGVTYVRDTQDYFTNLHDLVNCTMRIPGPNLNLPASCELSTLRAKSMAVEKVVASSLLAKLSP